MAEERRSADTERLKAERDAALAVAAESFRAALVDPIYAQGKPGPSIADLAHYQPDTEATANFQLQHRIADEMRRWLVPPEQRPICPLDNTPCTSWTCLVDVCVDAKKRSQTDGQDG